MSKRRNPKPNTPLPSAPSQPKASPKPADMDDTLERSKYVYEQINSWIENADNKVSVSCGIFTGVFGVVTFLAEQYIKIPDNPVINKSWQEIYKWSFVASLLVMASAVLLYALAIIPNLKSSGKNKSEKEYPVYFGDISTIDYEKYKNLMKNGNEQNFNEELILESWFNSGICTKKMKRYKIGVILSIIAVSFAFLSFICHFLMYR